MSRVYFTDRDLGNKFPDMLAAAGLHVERHRDHFAHDTPDEQWLAEVGARGWIAITHNSRIRYTPNELRAVTDNRVALLVVVGEAPFADLALSFTNTNRRIETFLERYRPPLIAKVYRATTKERGKYPNPPGRVELWYLG